MSIDLAEPADTREAILVATYRALRTHGYADLTIQSIGDELDKSPSLIYHHFEDKDDLVRSCLSLMLDQFESEYSSDPVENPGAALAAFVDRSLDPDLDEADRRFRRALVELRGQAGHDDAYRDLFVRTDDVFRERLAAILRAGIESGAFRDVDPDAVAATLLTLFSGAFYRRSSVGDGEWAAHVRAEVDAYLAARVYRSESATVTTAERDP